MGNRTDSYCSIKNNCRCDIFAHKLSLKRGPDWLDASDACGFDTVNGIIGCADKQKCSDAFLKNKHTQAYFNFTFN